MISAGRVLILPKGDYDSSTTYSLLDLVSYNGSSYIAKQSTTGNLPTDTTYWQLSAYGGSATNLAANFATVETTAYASQDYAVGSYLVDMDSQFCKVTVAIASGDEIVADTNVTVTSIEEVIAALESEISTADATNVKNVGVTEISTTTDLHTLDVGNYYKNDTSIYVTNAPTGIDSIPTAVFRLTVEHGATEDSSILLTLRTDDGGVYSQAYDGSDWSDWIENTPANLNVSDSAVTGSYVTAVSETTGKISVTREAADSVPTEDSEKMVLSGGVYSAITNAVAALDVTDTAVAGSYVTAVSETDGEIDVTREAADTTPTSGSTAMVTSGGVYTALADKCAESVVSDAYDSSTTYAVGDYFIYNDTLYYVDVACTGVTPPDTNYYTATSVASEISNLTSERMSFVFNETSSKDLDDYLTPNIFIIGSSDRTNWSNLPGSTGGLTIIVFANANIGTPTRTVQLAINNSTEAYMRLLISGSQRDWISLGSV